MAPTWLKKEGASKQRGNGPPPASEVARSTLVARLLDRPRPHRKGLPFPRVDDDGQPLGRFAVWVLTQEEVDLCRADAEKYASALCKHADKDDAPNQEAWRAIYMSALPVEVLARVLRDNDDLSVPLFRSPEEVRQLSDDEVVHLFEAYTALQQTTSPLMRTLTEDEVEQWIEALAEGANEYPLELCSRGQLVVLVLSLVSLMRSSPTGSGSSGSGSTDGQDGTPSSSSSEKESEA